MQANESDLAFPPPSWSIHWWLSMQV